MLPSEICAGGLVAIEGLWNVYFTATQALYCWCEARIRSRLCDSCVNGLGVRVLGEDANIMGFSRMLCDHNDKACHRFGLLQRLMIAVVWRWIKRQRWCSGGEGSQYR